MPSNNKGKALMTLLALVAGTTPKPSMTARQTEPSQHQETKKGYQHKTKVIKFLPLKDRHTAKLPSNHERVVARRAKAAGISVNDYKVWTSIDRLEPKNSVSRELSEKLINM